MTWRNTIVCLPLFWALGAPAFGQDVALNPFIPSINCDEPPGSVFCLDRSSRTNYEGEYIGHDEPSTLFYDSRPGSGNHMIYQLILPKDPPTAPRQDGMTDGRTPGGTFNFQLHPAFWFGMAICDTQSAPSPNPAGTCTPDSDANIFDNTNRLAPDYIGKHPGTAFLELQFYPPGWINSPGLVSSSTYFAALNIDSLSINYNTGQNNNSSCLNQVGQEPVNFAVITKNGIPLSPANPLGVAFGSSNPKLANALFMSPGDLIQVEIQDSAGGVMVTITDVTTGQAGSMIGGPAAGFGQVNWAPSAATCTVTPYAFHPMYSTSSEHTRVPWAVHTYNIAFADEIGHFELCNAFGTSGATLETCTSPGPEEVATGRNGSNLDADDFPCANPALFGLSSSFQNIIGCVGEDLDFDGQSYGFNWPGSNGDTLRDALLRPTPIQFTSPKFVNSLGVVANYERVAFEADLPAFEAGCDTTTGAGCTNPPAGAAFYPIFSTANLSTHQCWWQLGGGFIPGTSNNFGGSSTAEYGSLLSSAFPSPQGAQWALLNFHQTLSDNPCQTLP